MRSSGTTTVQLLRRGRRLLAVALALSFGVAFVVAVPLPGRRGRVRRTGGQRGRLREHQARQPQQRVGRHRGGQRLDPGLRHRDQREPGRDGRFKVKTTAANYRLDIYRMGYYGGTARARSPRSTPTSATDPAGLPDRGAPPAWSTAATGRSRRPGRCPTTAVSGIYFARLVRTTAPPAPATSSSSCATTPATRTCSSRPPTRPGRRTTTTAATACTQGRRPAARTRCSYNRPFDHQRRDRPRTSSSTPSTRWCASSRPTATTSATSAGVDTDRRGGAAREHRTFLSVGHDEYWSGGQRANVEAARDAGVNLAFFSGNEVFWKTRWENSIDGPGTAYRTLVCYKETHANAKIDPTARRGRGPGVTRGSARRPTAAAPRTR